MIWVLRYLSCNFGINLRIEYQSQNFLNKFLCSGVNCCPVIVNRYLKIMPSFQICNKLSNHRWSYFVMQILLGESSILKIKIDSDFAETAIFGVRVTHQVNKDQLRVKISQHSDNSTKFFYIQNNHTELIFQMTYKKLPRAPEIKSYL